MPFQDDVTETVARAQRSAWHNGFLAGHSFAVRSERFDPNLDEWADAPVEPENPYDVPEKKAIDPAKRYAEAVEMMRQAQNGLTVLAEKQIEIMLKVFELSRIFNHVHRDLRHYDEMQFAPAQYGSTEIKCELYEVRSKNSREFLMSFILDDLIIAGKYSEFESAYRKEVTK